MIRCHGARLTRGKQAGAEQQQPGQRAASLGGIHHPEFGRPARGGQEDRHLRLVGGDQPDQLLDVVECPLVAVQVAARSAAAARAPAVEPIDLHAVAVQVGSCLCEPAGVAGDAVEEDHDRRRWRLPAAPVQVVEPHAVAGREELTLGVAAGWVDHASVLTGAPTGVNGPATVPRRAQLGRSQDS